ncbi:peptidase inhibitor family I36 protein [Streptomyces griseorubiginosus]
MCVYSGNNGTGSRCSWSNADPHWLWIGSQHQDPLHRWRTS